MLVKRDLIILAKELKQFFLSVFFPTENSRAFHAANGPGSQTFFGNEALKLKALPVLSRGSLPRGESSQRKR